MGTLKMKPLPKLIEQREADEKRIAETLREVEAYWNQTAPYGAPEFDAGRGMALLLYEVNQYRGALNRIAGKAEEQEKLIKHREATGQVVTESDRQRLFAYLETAHIARQTLSTDRRLETSTANEA